YNKTVEFFEELMQLLHPFMPFVTEDIYHQLQEKEREDDLVVRLIQKNKSVNKEILKQGELLKEAITSIRDARNKNNVKLKDEIQLQIETPHSNLYKKFESTLSKQINSKITTYTSKAEPEYFTIVGNE